MDMFVALSDPTRRNIIELLSAEGKLTSTAISRKFKVTPPAISQHLKVLRESNLVDMEKQAQKHIYTINTDSLQEIEIWTRKMQGRWSERFMALEEILSAEKAKLTTNNRHPELSSGSKRQIPDQARNDTTRQGGSK